ncbi:GGDEF domain-containing protein [Marinomonas sp. 2405UD68-3]|uniref:GGDEF domain-containing protein n=1 Tax=Marinomonas sp. 2405UD68-3 TaxID=3391835 RepID=UPI0039C8E858
MIEFDIRTLSYVTMLVCLMMAGVMLLLSRVYPDSSSTRFWAIGNSITTIGFLFLGLRDIIPDLLSIPVSNTLIILGYLFILLGIGAFVNHTIRLWPLAAITIAMFISFMYFTYQSPNITARIIIISLVVSGIGFYSVWILWKDTRKEFRFLECLLSWLFIIHSIYLLVRAFITYIETPILDFMNANILHALSFFDVFIFSILLTFGFIFLLNKELQSRLKHLSDTDSLTGILNRGAFLKLIEQKSDHQKNQTPFSLIMIDIDHFKQINDTYGHKIGDIALVHTTNIINNALNKEQILGRLGGEEFCIALPDTNLVKAIEIAQEVLISLSSSPLIKDSITLNLTISIGVAEHQSSSNKIEDTLQYADEAMYKAKEAGRDCIKVYGT